MSERPVLSASLQRQPNEAIAAYAMRMHEAIGPRGTACSPLSAFLLLAWATSGNETRARHTLERALGMPAEAAAAWFQGVTVPKGEVLRLSMAVWNSERRNTPAFERWLLRYGKEFTTGPMPSQADADRWIQESSGGEIRQFPPTVLDNADLVLTNVCRFNDEWKLPPERTTSHQFQDPEWAERACGAIQFLDTSSHAFFQTRSAGFVAAHASHTARGGTVLSVLGEKDVPPHRVVGAGYEVAASLSGLPGGAQPVSLFDMPLGETPDWTIEEFSRRGCHDGGQHEFSSATIPAWEIRDDTIDLLAEETLGIRELVTVLDAVSAPGLPRSQACATQMTSAMFGPDGFSMTSWDGLGMTLGGHWPGEYRMVTHRHARIQFGRPFAVVAMALGDDGKARCIPRAHDMWSLRGVPFFSAWITEPRPLPA